MKEFSSENYASEINFTPKINTTSEDELRRIMEAQAVEVGWWKDYQTMETVADIEQAVAEGRAKRIPEVGKWYKISANTKEEFRVLESETAQLLEDISAEWGSRLTEKGLATAEGTDDKNVGNPFLVISSLARTIEYQRELQAQGFPAADGDSSTHTKLGAFDVAIAWFGENRPDLLTAFTEVLNEMDNEGKINSIHEPEVGAMHIARNPTYSESIN